MNQRPRDPDSVPTIAELRRLLEINAAASRFFRRELLRATDGWVREYLMCGGGRSVGDWFRMDGRPRAGRPLTVGGPPQVAWLQTVRRAGLGLISPEGRTIDRFRDQLMLPARNDRLEAAGLGRSTR